MQNDSKCRAFDQAAGLGVGQTTGIGTPSICRTRNGLNGEQFSDEGHASEASTTLFDADAFRCCGGDPFRSFVGGWWTGDGTKTDTVFTHPPTAAAPL
jgi:hypothetical protein